MPAVPMSSAEIAEDLTARIRAGEAGYQPGDRLPTYPQLMELYSVSEATIARVMLVLRTTGLVVGKPGRGTYVTDSGA